MKNSFLSLGLLLALNSGWSEDKAPEALPNQVEIGKLSEAFGHLIGKNIETIGVNFDMTQVVKGLQDSLAGKTAPMNESECIQAISTVQEKAFKLQAEENLKNAEAFLADNGKKEGVTSIENGKVQYSISEKGTGPAVEPHASPMIRYVGKFIDGKVFGTSKEAEPISLDETIPGLQAAVIGMKEGEKRIIHIHPELAYGTQSFLPPNSLLIFEIEVVKSSTSLPQIEEPISVKADPEAPKQTTGEVALPAVPVAPEVVR